jgi:hypothetical protein
VQILEAEVERLRVEEGGRKKEAEEYQTHLEEELAESQAQRAALLEEGASDAARTEALDAAKVTIRPCSLGTASVRAELRWARTHSGNLFKPAVRAYARCSESNNGFWCTTLSLKW